MKVNGERMTDVLHRDFSNATDMADYLVKKGLPFRQSHEVVGKCVRYCIEQEKWLMDLSLEEFKQFSPLFDTDILEAIKIETCVNARNSLGGTSSSQVGQSIVNAKNILTNQQSILDMYTKNNI
jgi:argininosuccinate lyase